MDKFIVDRGSKAEECLGKEKCRYVRFPVCLAIKYGEEVVELCTDFVFNISKGEIIVSTRLPLKEGARIMMHFYAPPDKKLLGEFLGEVVAVNTDNPLYQKGMYVRVVQGSQDNLRQLEEFIEERRHLVDVTI